MRLLGLTEPGHCPPIALMKTGRLGVGYVARTAAILGIGLMALSGACTIQADEDDSDRGPRCGDGTIDEGEVCDDATFDAFVSCTTNGFHAGELACSDDCTAVLLDACIDLDPDDDGLLDDQEAAIGTDPNLADTDTDGFTDGEEVDAGTDPLNMNSWPQDLGRWPNRTIQAQEAQIVPEGWAEGEVPPNVFMVDQYGAPLDLYQFYGYGVVVSVGATWCPPCNQAAATSQQLWQEHVGDGVIFIEQLVNGPQQGVNATDLDIQNWANQYSIMFPVTRSEQPIYATSLPTFFFFDKNLVLVEKIEGYPGDVALANKMYLVK